MGKLVLGIAAVLCLDLAFIAYLYSTKDPELRAVVKAANVRRPRPPKIAFPPPPNQPSVIKKPVEILQANLHQPESNRSKSTVTKPKVRSNDLAASSRKSRNFMEVRNASARKVDRNYAIAKPVRRSDTQTIKNETAATILYYGPRYGSEAPTVASVRPRKASFASRAVAIVKKPWTWLKAAGSKMF